ncbi:MAG TPA: M1 family aminopeptidase, partial [Rhodanobacteraceae bacterium]|nr:M1 family aminopeptidase [Rhodanobacteraceae bacterium]
MNATAGAKPTVFLRDYRAPAWRVTHVVLEIDLDPEATLVASRLTLEQDPAQPNAPLRLDGEVLELVDVALDGALLAPGAYALDAHALTIHGVSGRAVVQTRARIAPARNTALQGLYLAGAGERGFLLTQCEAEGFRRITWFTDRPDVLARYTVTLRADKARFPLLLANGNCDGEGDLDGGRHWARFVDPFPKPSYLFALVAGRLDRIEDAFVTAEGRRVKLFIHAEADLIGRCAWAMQCLKMAMRWDEERFGRCYDLDVFHVVATREFTMGAMENKGLNIFNAKYLVADPEHATDDDYRHVLAVVGHEYFHNWSGNRVTCRDWFQLSLKEGLTVYREQEFESDLASRTMRRIDDVRTLWRA